jgi:hypothetical protein
MVAYDAFISYCHARDTPIAAALQSTAQKLGKPWYRRRALRIYRDATNQAATPALWESIVRALNASRFLILIASPEAAASPWVDKEVAYWLTHKSANTLFIALTDGELNWDNQARDFLQRQGSTLPPALKGQFAAEPKWVDLRAYRSGDTRDAKFTELAADFAAAIAGVPKEDLLSQEVRQQRRALALAWSAAGLLVLLAAGATWQWRNAISAETAAVSERDRAQQALLISAARESLLLTREGRTEEAWHGLRNAVKVANATPATRMPGIVSEAALSALVENRLGPELVLEPSGEPSEADAERPGPSEPNVIAGFDPRGERVAVAKGADIAIWSTTDGSMQNRFHLWTTVAQLFFHESENILFLIGRAEADEKESVVLIDLASGHYRALPLRECLGLLPCIADAGAENSVLRDLQQYDGVRAVIESGLNGRALLVRRSGDPGHPTPGLSFVGLVSDWLYVFDGPVVFDPTTQQITQAEPGGGPVVAVAAHKPLVAVGNHNDATIQLFEIKAAEQGAGLSIRKLRTVEAEGATAVSQLTLSDDGALLYWSSATQGSGGFGARLAGALDVDTGRQVWRTNFDGHSVFAPAQNYIARSFVDPRTGHTVTDVVNGRTSERLFSLPAIAVAFDPSGRLALVEMPQASRSSTSEGTATQRYVLRLAELSTVPSFANDGSWPHAIPVYVKNRCETNAVPFLTLSMRIGRTWNPYDWHRESAPPDGAAEAAAESDANSPLTWRWNAGNFELRRGDMLIASGTREDIIMARPDFAALIEPETDMTVAFMDFINGNFVIVTRQSARDWQEPGSWFVYKNSGHTRTLLASGTYPRSQRRGYKPSSFHYDERARLQFMRTTARWPLWAFPTARCWGNCIPPTQIPMRCLKSERI